MMLHLLIDNLNQIRYRIAHAARRAGRDPEAIALVAVTKYANLSDVTELLQMGAVTDVGESRVQDAERKKSALGELAGKVRWRLLGHLQTNKAKKAAAVFDAVDSVDSVKVAAALDAARRPEDGPLPVMVQVKLSAGQTQSGVTPQELPALLAALNEFSRVRVEGLMAIAPNVAPLENVRPSFRALRELRDQCLPQGKLSMGMSRDFEIAVEEGADLVRIGSQIFTQKQQASLEAPA